MARREENLRSEYNANKHLKPEARTDARYPGAKIRDYGEMPSGGRLWPSNMHPRRKP